MTEHNPRDWRAQAEADTAWLESQWRDERDAAWRRERRKTRLTALAIALVWLAGLALGVHAFVQAWEQRHALAQQGLR